MYQSFRVGRGKGEMGKGRGFLGVFFGGEGDRDDSQLH